MTSLDVNAIFGRSCWGITSTCGFAEEEEGVSCCCCCSRNCDASPGMETFFDKRNLFCLCFVLFCFVLFLSLSCCIIQIVYETRFGKMYWDFSRVIGFYFAYYCVFGVAERVANSLSTRLHGDWYDLLREMVGRALMMCPVKLKTVGGVREGGMES